jgi:hypothetical protein
MVLPVWKQLFSPIESAVLALHVTTDILKDTCRTTAGNFIQKSNIETEEVLLSTGQVMPIWLYLVTLCVVVREIYCNVCLWVHGAHLSVV